MQEADLKESERYIEEECPEITVGEDLAWGNKILKAFPAFGSRNYSLYFFGQLISLIGTWLQIVAEGWLVFEITNSAFWVGFVTAMGTLPTLFLTLFGGVIVDHFPKKYILIATQTSAMILAAVYGVLTVTHHINILEISILALLLGCVNAVDAPARQAYVNELVPREALGSAIALNGGIYNGARVIGPSIAGFLIALYGSGGAFLLNALSYVAVIIALFFINTPVKLENKHLRPLKAIKEGLGYAFAHPLIRSTLIFAGVVSIFGWSYTTLLPVIAKNIFHLNAVGLGYLYAASGLGALAAMFAISVFSHRVSRNIFIIGGNLLFAVAIFLFTFTTYLPMALVLLFIGGFGLLSQFAMMNTTIMHMVDDNLRGRVMSIYTLMFLGMLPLGSFEAGTVAEYFGPDFAIKLGAAVVFIFGIFAYFNRRKVSEALARYESENNH